MGAAGAAQAAAQQVDLKLNPSAAGYPGPKTCSASPQPRPSTQALTPISRSSVLTLHPQRAPRTARRRNNRQTRIKEVDDAMPDTQVSSYMQQVQSDENRKSGAPAGTRPSKFARGKGADHVQSRRSRQAPAALAQVVCVFARVRTCVCVCLCVCVCAAASAGVMWSI